MTITCGCSMVEGLARTDCQIGSVNPWTSYVGNAFKGANMGLMAGASFVNVPYGAEMLAAELAPAGLIVNVGNTYVRGETLITAAMNAATFTNMMLVCNETHAYASGENALAELMGQDTYELARDAASAGSAMTLMAAMCNPRMYGYGSEANNIRQMAGYDNGEEDGVTDFYVGSNGKVLPSQYKDWIGTNKQKELLDQVENSQLQNAIKQLYRGNSFIGDGGTADAIRFEQQTGLMLGKNGGSHIQKGLDMAKYIENKVLFQSLSPSDRNLATQLLENLNSVLGR